MRERNLEGCENMARTQALDWGAWRAGQVKPKVEEEPLANLLISGVLAFGLITFATHTVPAIAAAGSVIPAIAGPGGFEHSLSVAAQPIHAIIRGFAHEIYAIFMGWGAIEAMIGKPQQGFTRMKTATLGYVLLFWVPTIIDLVNKARPGV